MLETTIGGRYLILKELGRGAFGQTYLAEDRQIPGHPKCVVKQLKPQSNDELTLREARRLFTKEAEVLSRLSGHPQIPRLLAYYPEEFCLVQELISGHDLSEEITPDKQLSEAEVIALLREVLEVLKFIHGQYVIHRDLKPSNIRRNSEGKLVLIDFGTVKEIQTLMLDPKGKLTTTIVAGTQGYMPPEQLQGKPRPNSDIYALGMIAIFALTGVSPTQLEEDAQTCDVLWRHQTAVSKELGDLIDKMVHFDCSQRYQSATEVLHDLEAITNTKWKGTPLKWRRWLLVGVSSIVILMIGVIGFPFARGIYLYQRGNAQLEAEEYQSAIAFYEEVLAIHPNWARVWFKQGVALQELELYREAFVAYERALKLNPQDEEILEKREQVLQKLSENALKKFDKNRPIQPLP